MPGLPDGDEPYVLVARDLAPADTVLLNPALVLGFGPDDAAQHQAPRAVAEADAMSSRTPGRSWRSRSRGRG